MCPPARRRWQGTTQWARGGAIYIYISIYMSVCVLVCTQEVAGNHAVGMWGRSETGFANMPGAADLVFVMTRQQLRMQKYPKW